MTVSITRHVQVCTLCSYHVNTALLLEVTLRSGEDLYFLWLLTQLQV